jgi:hypothetical protein
MLAIQLRRAVRDPRSFDQKPMTGTLLLPA